MSEARFIEPMLLRPSSTLPAVTGWVYELKRWISCRSHQEWRASPAAVTQR
jgi:hypothetical protein